MPFIMNGLEAQAYCRIFLTPADLYFLLTAMANDDPSAEINTIEALTNSGFLTAVWS